MGNGIATTNIYGILCKIQMEFSIKRLSKLSWKIEGWLLKRGGKLAVYTDLSNISEQNRTFNK